MESVNPDVRRLLRELRRDAAILLMVAVLNIICYALDGAAPAMWFPLGLALVIPIGMLWRLGAARWRV